MPRFYHEPSTTPPQVADMPLDALRSQLYPVHPHVPDRVWRQQGQPLPIGMPQRMAFTRFKSGSAAVVYGQNVESVVSARDYWAERSGVVKRAAGVPPVIMTPASFATSNGATALRPVNIDPDIKRAPIARGYLPPNRYLGVDDLNRFVREEPAARVEARINEAEKATSAMQQVHAIRASIVERVRGKR